MSQNPKREHDVNGTLQQNRIFFFLKVKMRRHALPGFFSILCATRMFGKTRVIAPVLQKQDRSNESETKTGQMFAKTNVQISLENFVQTWYIQIYLPRLPDVS